MKPLLTALAVCFGHPVWADHIPPANSINPLVIYQHDAAQKRYADILKIADLLDRYQAATGMLPQLAPNNGSADVYQVAVLGQPLAVDAVFRNGTPFGFSLIKFRPQRLLDVLRGALGDDVTLPLDPQSIGTHFAPVYFVFIRAADGATPAHYIVLGTFGQDVAASTAVADNVHLVAIANIDLPFIVPVKTRDSFDPAFVAHVMSDGDAADAVFARTVDVVLD